MEKFFADLMGKQIKRGGHRSTVELEQAITEYIEAVNEETPIHSDGTSPPPTSSQAIARDVIANGREQEIKEIQQTITSVAPELPDDG